MVGLRQDDGAAKGSHGQLIAEYANDFPTEIASQRVEQYRRLQGSALAWSGPVEPGQKHYYRVQTRVPDRV
jgi:hypothetical protein